jgi:phage terminase large subunit-like protein
MQPILLEEPMPEVFAPMPTESSHGHEVADKNKKSVDDWLDEVDYGAMNTGTYVPSKFALNFMNFIKLVNGEQGESNKTPVVHLKMLDKIAGKKQRIANLCARGMAKTTLMFEYLAPYVAVFGGIEGFGAVDGIIYVSDSMDNGVKSARKNIEFRYNNSEFLQEWLPGAHFTDNYIEFTNKQGRKLGIKMFGAKTGLRGTKIFGKRPVLAILDDLVSDDDAKSKVSMEAIKDTIYKGVDYALDPTKRKIVFNGTPFNKTDILYEAVESGAWDVNVWPICEEFPCSREEFKGAWDDRFTYDFVNEQYQLSILSGKLSAFNQELMLRISSEEERLVQDSEIRWYPRKTLLNNRGRYNFYITTDFATSDAQTADYSVISVWAYNSNGDWFWVDGACARQTMDKSIDDLFRLVSEYRPQSVGVEITGQQGAFIQWLQREQMNRNVWFNFAQEKGKPGIRPITNKLSRFNLVVPMFKAGKIYFPEELRKSKILEIFLGQIRLATINGLKGKDDCLDTISMLMNMNPWKPSEDAGMTQGKDKHWDMDEDDDDMSSAGMSSYIV